jgi:hypothetical protein
MTATRTKCPAEVTEWGGGRLQRVGPPGRRGLACRSLRGRGTRHAGLVVSVSGRCHGRPRGVPVGASAAMYRPSPVLLFACRCPGGLRTLVRPRKGRREDPPSAHPHLVFRRTVAPSPMAHRPLRRGRGPSRRGSPRRAARRQHRRTPREERPQRCLAPACRTRTNSMSGSVPFTRRTSASSLLGVSEDPDPSRREPPGRASTSTGVTTTVSRTPASGPCLLQAT